MWPPKRVGDVAKIGPQHIVDNKLQTRDENTGKQNSIPISRELKRAIDAILDKNLCFIVTAFGEPYSQKGLSQAFSQWCTDAGLKHFSVHGLRKAMSSRMAENQSTNSQMKAITQHSDDAQLAVYIRDADQSRLAEKTIALLKEAYSAPDRIV